MQHNFKNKNFLNYPKIVCDYLSEFLHTLDSTTIETTTDKNQKTRHVSHDGLRNHFILLK